MLPNDVVDPVFVAGPVPSPVSDFALVQTSTKSPVGELPDIEIISTVHTMLSPPRGIHGLNTSEPFAVPFAVRICAWNTGTP